MSAAALDAPPSTKASTSVDVPTSRVTLALPEASRTSNVPPMTMLSAGKSINLTTSSPANEVLSIIEREKAIFEKQLAESDKPKEIQEKIIDGKLNKFFNENCLLGQSFVKDPDKSIDDLLKEQDNEILSFHRFKVGDGIDTATKDFAEEVAEQLK